MKWVISWTCTKRFFKYYFRLINVRRMTRRVFKAVAIGMNWSFVVSICCRRDQITNSKRQYALSNCHISLWYCMVFGINETMKEYKFDKVKRSLNSKLIIADPRRRRHSSKNKPFHILKSLLVKTSKNSRSLDPERLEQFQGSDLIYFSVKDNSTSEQQCRFLSSQSCHQKAP